VLSTPDRAAYIHNFINLHKSVKRLVYKLVPLYNVRMDAEMKTERITTMMTPSEVKVIDDWAFANRIRSRGEAIRRLIETGLKAAKPSVFGGGTPDTTPQPATSVKTAAPRAKKPTASDRQASPAQTKEAQIRALREQGAVET
jgi:hypothetical protein